MDMDDVDRSTELGSGRETGVSLPQRAALLAHSGPSWPTGTPSHREGRWLTLAGLFVRCCMCSPETDVLQKHCPLLHCIVVKHLALEP